MTRGSALRVTRSKYRIGSSVRGKQYPEADSSVTESVFESLSSHSGSVESFTNESQVESSPKMSQNVDNCIRLASDLK